MQAVASLVVLITLGMFGTAVAQTKTQTKTHSFTVKQGATVPIGSYYQINTQTCQAGPIPKIVQTSKPNIGKLIIEETKIEPSQKQCNGFLIPGYIVRFQAGDKPGEEKVTYEVIYNSKKLGRWKIEDTIIVQWCKSGRTTLPRRPSAVALAMENMDCATCPYIVKSSLEAVPGVVTAVVSLKEKTAIVTYDDAKADVKALTTATTNAGYPSAPKS